MMSIGARTWQVVKPHIPLIKFRKGGKEPYSDLNQNYALQMPSSQRSQTSIRSQTIDEFQLPAKYSRKPLSQLEIETIERGGSENSH